MTMYEDERPHPLGLIDNPEWQVTLTKRAELYIAERERRNNPEREPSRFHIAVGIVAALLVAVALVGALT